MNRHVAILLARLFGGSSLNSSHYHRMKYNRCQRSPTKLVCMAIVHSLWSQRPSECHVNMLDAGTAPLILPLSTTPMDTSCYTGSFEGSPRGTAECARGDARQSLWRAKNSCREGQRSLFQSKDGGQARTVS